MRTGIALVVNGCSCDLASDVARANGRPPLTNGVHFQSNDNHSIYVADDVRAARQPRRRLLVSTGCASRTSATAASSIRSTRSAPTGTIFATTFTGLRVSHDAAARSRPRPQR